MPGECCPSRFSFLYPGCILRPLYRFPRLTLVCLQVGPVQDSADLPHTDGGVWGDGVRLSIPHHLHHHALLSGSSELRSAPHSLHHPWVFPPQAKLVPLLRPGATGPAWVMGAVCLAGLELCEPSLRLVVNVLAGQMTLAGELLLLAVVLGCKTWRCLLGAGAAPLTLFLSYGYVSISWLCISLLL